MKRKSPKEKKSAKNDCAISVNAASNETSSEKKKKSAKTDKSTIPETKSQKKSTKNDFVEEMEALFSEKKRMKKEEVTKESSIPSTQERPKLDTRSADAKSITLQGDRNDLSKIKEGEWVQDGLGGVFDKEGFTGRNQDGYRIYKAHLMNKPGFGRSKKCPFDCDCCYI